MMVISDEREYCCNLVLGAFWVKGDVVLGARCEVNVVRRLIGQRHLEVHAGSCVLKCMLGEWHVEVHAGRVAW